MGSRIMHLIIADQVFEHLCLRDHGLFLVGSIAADAAESKDDSHFYEGDIDEGTRHIHYQRYLRKYRSRLSNEFVLGYLTHLIADDRWLKDFYLSWLKERLDRDPSLLAQYHCDFRLLNKRLIKYYNKPHLKEVLEPAEVKAEIDEVKPEAVQDVKKQALQDFEWDSENQQELQVFTFEQIVEYIEKSTRQSLQIIRHIEKGESQ